MDLESQKFINTIQKSLIKEGIDVEKTPEMLMQLRDQAIEQEIPTAAKVLRLSSEHIQANNGFYIPMPAEEPVDVAETEEDEEPEPIEPDPIETPKQMVESLDYMLALIAKSENPANLAELREYRDRLKAF